MLHWTCSDRSSVIILLINKDTNNTVSLTDLSLLCFVVFLLHLPQNIQDVAQTRTDRESHLLTDVIHIALID